MCTRSFIVALFFGMKRVFAIFPIFSAEWSMTQTESMEVDGVGAFHVVSPAPEVWSHSSQQSSSRSRLSLILLFCPIS